MFPVEEKIGEIRAALAAGRDVVLTAPPGSGKTTCVPPALLDEPWLAGKKIVMLEPRRLAARNCATYIAKKLGEPVGGTVGYQVRLERKVSKATRLEVVTEGLLTNRIMDDPELGDVGLIIFDEFHERSLQCDLAYALALDVQRALRPDLRLLVMSATLDAEAVLASLAGSLAVARPADSQSTNQRIDESTNSSAVQPSTSNLQPPKTPALVRAEGRMFPVEVKYLGEVSMVAAIEVALRETDGDVLCFLPGEGEIKKIQRMIDSSNDRFAKVEALPLYGSLPKEEQDRVFKKNISHHCPPPPTFSTSVPRRVILATSIAETSVTIEGVTAVVDSGLMRVPRFSPATGMSGLVTLPLTLDRAEQRRGRAGRVRAGVCYRLWTEASEASRPKKAMPEILDADLAQLTLTSSAWGALRREDLPWMTPPPASAWEQSVGLLKALGALDVRGQLTAKGQAMAKLPMHPRLAAMMVEGGRRWSEEVEVDSGGKLALYAAIIEEGGRSRETDIRYVPVTPRIKQLAKRFSHFGGSRRGQQADDNKNHRCSTSNLQPSTCSPEAALALAYPDRVAKNRGNGTFTMVSGRGALLPDDDPLAHEEYLVCCELDDRLGDAKIFLAAPITESEIEALFGERITEEPYCEWDRRAERVKAVVKRRLGAMTIKENSSIDRFADSSIDLPSRIVEAMMDGIRQKGVENLPCWTKETRQLKARIDFFFHHQSAGADEDNKRTTTRTTAVQPSTSNLQPVLQPSTSDLLLSVLPGFLAGMNKWRDLEKLDLGAVLDAVLAAAGHTRRELDRFAPVRMEVPSGSNMLIHYEGDEPTCEVRLQECFGLMRTPKVADGRVSVVMTLLSPAQRPCAVTKDLENFWREGYPLVRKDLRGRYPKHYWPEDPFTAVATRRVRPKPTP